VAVVCFTLTDDARNKVYTIVTLLLLLVVVVVERGKRPIGRPRPRCEEGIKIDLREIGWGCRVDTVFSG
jgi:hypothetical protein